MKKVIRKGVMILAIFATVSSYANKVSYTSTTNDTKKTTLRINNVKRGHQLLIKDTRGSIFYKEFIKDSGQYSKGFDLTSLPNGEYFFEIDKDVEIKTIPFKVISKEVIFDKEAEHTIYKPVVHKKDNLVYVSRVSFDEKPLEFKIYYEDNVEFIVKEKFINKKNIGRIYDFSKARQGNYRIIFKTEGRVFIENIKV